MIHSFTLHDTGEKVFLGRNITPVAERKPTLRFAAYLDTEVAQPPATLDFTPKAMDAIQQMYMNNRLGCCVMSDQFHSVGIWSANAVGTPIIGTDDEVVSAYHSICGGGDNGCNIADVLDHFQQNGIMMGGKTRKILGRVSVDWTNALEVKIAMYLFGPLNLGVSLPGSWENSQTWDITNSGIVGGHDIPTLGYNDTGPPIATWGGIRQMTWQAFQSNQYVGECYARLSPDSLNNNLNQFGVDEATLQSDLQKLANGQIPDIEPSHLWDWSIFA